MTNERRRSHKILQGRLTMLKHELSQEYARWNKNVFKSFIKEYALIGQSEHLWEDSSRRAGLRLGKLSRQTIAKI